jgi:hypothetical protein
VPEEDVAFRIVETARENWWAAGRVIDPTTGYDERMTSIVEQTGLTDNEMLGLDRSTCTGGSR